MVMKRFLRAAVCICSLSGAVCVAQADILKEVDQFEQKGQFKQAAGLMTTELKNKSLPAAERKKVEFELDRLERIKKDFPYTKTELFAELKKSVKGLTSEEYERWINEGRFDSREVDGERRFMSSSVSNLYFRYPELASRRLPPKDTASLERARWESCVTIKKAALAEGKPFVLPKRFHVTMSVTAKSTAAPADEIIRAWLPIPRQYPFQNDFEFLSAFSKVTRIDDEQTPLRAIYLEQSARKDKPAVFKIEYNYTTHGVWFDLKPGEVRPGDPNDPALKEFTREAPHVVFTPEIRALSQQIAGEESNPCLKAKKFYDWIAGQIKYSYAIEYSTIRNISDYCRTKGYGDCGQESLLFISLCRLNGIPARGQSGWNTFSGEKTIHDWSEIFIAPYGWVPVDPYMGIFAMRYATTLTPEQ